MAGRVDADVWIDLLEVHRLQGLRGCDMKRGGLEHVGIVCLSLSKFFKSLLDIDRVQRLVRHERIHKRVVAVGAFDGRLERIEFLQVLKLNGLVVIGVL